jgi:hypothetical protein
VAEAVRHGGDPADLDRPVRDSHRALALGLAVAGLYLAAAAAGGRLSPFARRPILDGFAPPPPYRWVSPPPDLASTNRPPSAGRFTLSLSPGTGSKADVFSTADGQVSLALGDGAIPSRQGEDSALLTITPMAPATGAEVPRKLQIAGNVYRIAAEYEPSGTPILRLRSPARLVMAYPLPIDVAVYHHTLLHSENGDSWTPLRSTDSLVGQLVHADVTELGFFAVGQAVLGTTTPSAPSGGGTVFVVVLVAGFAVLAVIVVAEIRRRARRRAARSRRPPPPRRRPPPPRRRVDPWE